MSSAATKGILKSHQAVLEQNEDLIAAVVENMQLGRLSDCFTHYSMLQSNLISLALELDDYPVIDTFDPFESIHEYPDEIMRKDVLDDIRPRDQIPISTRNETAPPCESCHARNWDDIKCRIELEHVAPSHTFTNEEKLAFRRVARVLYSQCPANQPLSEPGVNYLVKRVHRRWSVFERHSVLLAVSIYGPQNYNKIAGTMNSRSTSQVANYIQKKIETTDLQNAAKGILPPAPEGYEPPTQLTRLLSSVRREREKRDNETSLTGTAGSTKDKDRPSSGLPDDVLGVSGSYGSTDGISGTGCGATAGGGEGDDPLAAEELRNIWATSLTSGLAPKRGENKDWTSLIRLGLGGGNRAAASRIPQGSGSAATSKDSPLKSPVAASSAITKVDASHATVPAHTTSTEQLKSLSPPASTANVTATAAPSTVQLNSAPVPCRYFGGSMTIAPMPKAPPAPDQGGIYSYPYFNLVLGYGLNPGVGSGQLQPSVTAISDIGGVLPLPPLALFPAVSEGSILSATLSAASSKASGRAGIVAMMSRSVSSLVANLKASEAFQASQKMLEEPEKPPSKARKPRSKAQKATVNAPLAPEERVDGDDSHIEIILAQGYAGAPGLGQRLLGNTSTLAPVGKPAKSKSAATKKNSSFGNDKAVKETAARPPRGPRTKKGAPVAKTETELLAAYGLVSPSKQLLGDPLVASPDSSMSMGGGLNFELSNFGFSHIGGPQPGISDKPLAAAAEHGYKRKRGGSFDASRFEDSSLLPGLGCEFSFMPT